MEDIMYMLEYIPVVSDVMDAFGTISAVWTIFSIVILIAMYIYSGLTRMLIGHKAGLDNDWMPFVPFASTIYRLQITGEQWWKMFFLGIWQWLFWGSLVSVLLVKIHMVVFTIFIILYTLACIAYYIYYLNLYYRAFNINPLLIIATIAMMSPTINMILDVLIGYTDLINYGSEAQGQNKTKSQQSQQKQFQSQSEALGGSITCLSGMYSGNTFNMVPDEEMTIGREASECNIVLERNADKVSRKHVGILYNPGNRNYYVTDYSSNGTLTKDGSRLVKNIPTTLPSGTVICLGNNENRFMLN